MKKRIEFNGDVVYGTMPKYFEFDSRDGELYDGQNGVGEVAYAEGSVYRGSLVYRNGKLNKYGYGEQDFTNTNGCFDTSVGAPRGVKLYKYVGAFDYTVTDWIYGNGVMYFTDESGKPSCYAIGWFVGITKRGEYVGEFKKELLLPEYEGLPQIELTPFGDRFAASSEKAKEQKSCKSVLIGDSWFEFYEKGSPDCPAGTFLVDSKGKSVVNLAIGGTTFGDWERNVNKVLGGIKFEQAFINLGYNDVHVYEPIEKVMAGFINTVAAIRKINAKAKIFVNAVCPSPACPKSRGAKSELNARIKEYCKRNGMTFVPCNERLSALEGDPQELWKAFAADGIHLTEKGYALWAPAFVKFF